MAAVQTVAPNSAGESSAAALNWLVCCAGSYLCALPLAQVIETMRPLPIEYLAHTPAFVRGVSVIRGAPVPIVDIGILFGEAASRTGRLVTIKVGDGNQVALAVGDVLGIRSIPPADTGAMPSLLRDTDEGIVSHDRRA